MDLHLARNLSRRAILVALHQREHGPRPVAAIARETGLSVRSVYLALEELQNLAHDHDLHGLHGIEDKEPVQDFANEPPAAVQDPARNPEAPAPEDEPAAPADDPVVSELVSHGIWPGPARRLVALVGAAAIRLQLAYHAFRLARGFRFRKAAAFLYAACRNPHQYPAPEGFHAAAHLEREGIAPPARTPARPAREPEPAPAPLTLEDRLNTIRGLLSSSIPAARRRAAKLAREWGLDWTLEGKVALVELVAPAPGLVAV